MEPMTRAVSPPKRSLPDGVVERLTCGAAAAAAGGANAVLAMIRSSVKTGIFGPRPGRMISSFVDHARDWTTRRHPH